MFTAHGFLAHVMAGHLVGQRRADRTRRDRTQAGLLTERGCVQALARGLAQAAEST